MIYIMLRFINMRAFIVSLGVGLLFAYLSSPTHNVVFVYPTPEIKSENL